MFNVYVAMLSCMVKRKFQRIAPSDGCPLSFLRDKNHSERCCLTFIMHARAWTENGLEYSISILMCVFLKAQQYLYWYGWPRITNRWLVLIRNGWKGPSICMSPIYLDLLDFKLYISFLFSFFVIKYIM